MSWKWRLDRSIKGLDEALSELSSGLGINALRSSTKQAILMSLAINRKMKFTELIKLTGTGKGSLWNHLEQMENEGLVKKQKSHSSLPQEVTLK